MNHSKRRTGSTLVVQGVNLCKYCEEREGLRTNLRSPNEECSLCGGLLSQLTKMASTVVEKSREYEFDTFLIGASLPQSLLDKEDELRARLKIKGKENVKSQITRIVSRKVALATGKKIDYSRPDLTVLISPAESTVILTSRSIWLKGAYRKLVRGIAQRASICEVCNGVGCAACNYSGKKGNSVQSIISSYFMKLFKAESCNFVWLGSEDENSLVEGDGRPFFVEMMKPKKRAAPRVKKKTRRRGDLAYYSEQGVEIAPPEKLKSKPQQVPQFEVLARVYLKRNESPNSTFRAEDIAKDFKNVVVSVRLSRKYRMVQRKIRSIEAEAKDSSATLTIRCDGGIPLKKLVTGQDGTVEPNMSPYVSGYEIEKERPFDVLDVKIKNAETASSSLADVMDEDLAATA
jgi:tRNA pseudouridine synthase 10